MSLELYNVMDLIREYNKNITEKDRLINKLEKVLDEINEYNDKVNQNNINILDINKTLHKKLNYEYDFNIKKYIDYEYARLNIYNMDDNIDDDYSLRKLKEEIIKTYKDNIMFYNLIKEYVLALNSMLAVVRVSDE